MDEDAGEARFEVSLSTNSRYDISVDYTTTDGTALAGSDYEAVSGTLAIPSPDFGGTIVVPILDDFDDEPDESFTVTLSNPERGRIHDGEAIGAITDDDEPLPPGVPSLSIDDVFIGEDGGAARFTVTLSDTFEQAVSVDYGTMSGTADADVDYTHTTGTLTVDAGSLTGMISVPILDDELDEPDETFTVTLSDATNASITDAQGLATITDNDEPPSLGVDDVTVAEHAGNAEFTVTLSNAYELPVTVQYATSDGTAEAGSDYTNTSGTLTMVAGSLSASVLVPVLDDDLVEPDETFQLNLGQATHATIADGQGQATIAENDQPPATGVVGVAKQAVDTHITNSGTVRSVIRIHIANVGDGEAHRVQVADDLAQAFPSPAEVSIVEAPGLTGAALTLNRAYDGTGNIELLSGTDTLAAGAAATVEFTVEVALNGAVGLFQNQATAFSEDDAGVITEDLSDNGDNPDPDGDGDPSGPGEDDATPVGFPAALRGTVFADRDVDGVQDAGDPGLAGWLVEAATADGGSVSRTTTDSAGGYLLVSVDPGDVRVRFRHPESEAVWGEETATVTRHSVTTIDHGIVPGGRVYDSATRAIIVGAVVALADSTGRPVSDACLLDGQQSQRTGSDGAYRFDIVHGAHGDCPRGASRYRVEITHMPDGYNAPPSLLIPPAGDALTVSSCPGDPNPEAPCVVYAEAQPPTGTTTADYYLAWVAADGDGTVVHNHLPLDPVSVVAPDRLVTVTKRATARSANLGDLVGYIVQVSNPTSFNIHNLELVDDIPAGFTFAEETASLQRPGPDGTLGTRDDPSTALATTGTDPIVFAPIDVPAGAVVSLRYLTRITGGASPGHHVNRVKPLVAGQLVGNEATAGVEVLSDPMFEKTTVIGKVFDDRNGNGWQDPGDRGVPGVRLATVSGLIVETDAHGRYHIADVSVGDAERGRNFIVKLDPKTLPSETEITSENPRVIRLTQALMSKVNFAVKLPAQAQASAIEQKPGGNRLVREIRSHNFERIEPVRFASGKSGILPSYVERLRALLAAYRGKPNLRIRFSGHTDSQPLGPIAQRIFSDNQGLSEARARQVANVVIAELGVSEDIIEITGHAERMPVATNRTDEGMALNRRVETEVLYDGYAEEERILTEEQPGAAPFKAARSAAVERAEETPVGAQSVKAPAIAVTEPSDAQSSQAQPHKALSVAVQPKLAHSAESHTGGLQVADVRVADSQAGAPQPGGRYPVGKAITEVRHAVETTRVEPARFASGRTGLSSDQAARVDRSLEPFADMQIVGIKVVGHSDALPVLTGNADENDNEALSRARAQSVAAYLAGKLQLEPGLVVVDARGSSDPIADNGTAAGRALNRRADIELTYRRVAETVTTRVIALAPVQIAATQHIGGGRLWLTEDALAHRPQLDVLALSDLAVDASGTMKTPVEFAAYTNYAAWTNEYRLELYRESDTDLVRPLATLTTARLEQEKAFEFFDESLNFKRGERLAYVLKATDEKGREDQTRPRLVGTVNARRPQQPRDPASIRGQSNLAKQSIAVRGSRVRIHGEGYAPGESLRVDGQQVTADGNGGFVAELHLSPGSRQIVVSGESDGQTWSQSLTAEVDENYTFLVGLANVTIGQTSVSDSFEEIDPDDSFDESVNVDGRLAFYLKAKVRGRYLITAQLDTTEDELDNLGDNLKRKDPRRVFRQLDPDRYYPVYGDDSTTVSDVNSQGPFYLRVDWDRSQLLLGNFNTGLTDTEYMQYNRSLYGGKYAHKSVAETRFGDSRRSLTAFASEAQSAAAHVSFRATGGSLYYLKHTDIVLGSEKVWVEVRQRDTAQVLERQDYIAGRDYEIDALQGRIILNRPLSQVIADRGLSIIRARPLEGDDVFLLVDYEYVPDAFDADKMTYGARGKAWFGDHVAVGASKIVAQRDGQDFDLEGIDVTLKAGKGTYLSVEAARSESLLSSAGFDSVDGGLSFLARSGDASSSSLSGDALAVEGRVNLAEYSDRLAGDVRAWWKQRDEGFSAGRLGHRHDTVEKGIDAIVQAGENINLQAGYAERNEGPLATSRVGRLQADVRTGRFTVGGELRHEDIRRTAPYGIEVPDGDALLAGVRLGYDLDTIRTIYASAQTGLDESGNTVENDRVALGIDTQVSDSLAVSLEASEGDRGSALSGGFEYSPAQRYGLKVDSGIGSGALTRFSGNYALDEGHELYGSYALDPDRTFGERNLLTLGQRRDMGNRLGIFTESQFGDDDRIAGASHPFGVDY